MAEQGKPDPGPVLDLLNAFRRSAVLFSTVDLGVFEALAASGNGCLTIEQLGDALRLRGPRAEGVSADGLDRLCRAAVGLGLLDCPSPSSYSLTPVSAAYLVSASPDALTGYCTHSQQVVWPLFSGLPAAVTTGSNVWRQQFGQPGADVFARIYSTPPDVLRFMRGMYSFSTLSAPSVVRVFDLAQHLSRGGGAGGGGGGGGQLQDSGAGDADGAASGGGGAGGGGAILLDLGGATGALAAAACAAYPACVLREAVVVDLPHVVAQAEAHFAPPPGGPCEGRLRWLAADFFEERDKLPQQVDLVILSRIIHDWDDARCVQLLRLAHRLLRPGGAVLLAEMLLRPDRLGPPAALLQDLNMLCQTHGRERSAEEYGGMLAAAGFVGAEGRTTGSYLDAVLAVKPL
ncbi:Acetylserotonin O-methyltransferase, partial [Tetrabaena socialis]